MCNRLMINGLLRKPNCIICSIITLEITKRMNMTIGKARVIAFYLPQFHPIPENDNWWGKGFTEWTNVGKAKPLFRGHYQPRVPADLGYYDLRMPEVREAQAEMARNAGIEGFMYWHYWFGNGKTLLERPFKEVLESGKPDFPFCLSWANHSWEKKTWNPSVQNEKNKVLIEQLYPGKKDYIDHFYYNLRAFQDKRYIQVDGKQLFYIFDPLGFNDCKIFINTWQELAVKNGLKGIHFTAKMDTRYDDMEKLLSIGFDSINTRTMMMAECKVKGKYHRLLTLGLNKYLPFYIAHKYKYSEIIKHLISKYDVIENVYPSLIPQWDHSPRSGKNGIIYHGSTPELFRKHTKMVVNCIKNKKQENRIVILKSWNEWAEANYIEPDIVFGDKYLTILREELSEDG